MQQEEQEKREEDECANDGQDVREQLSSEAKNNEKLNPTNY